MARFSLVGYIFSICTFWWSDPQKESKATGRTAPVSHILGSNFSLRGGSETVRLTNGTRQNRQQVHKVLPEMLVSHTTLGVTRPSTMTIPCRSPLLNHGAMALTIQLSLRSNPLLESFQASLRSRTNHWVNVPRYPLLYSPLFTPLSFFFALDLLWTEQPLLPCVGGANTSQV
jgi:hypothetical protein